MLSTLQGRLGQPAANVQDSDGLSTLVYRSRAVRPMTEADWCALLPAAQVRNRSEGVTGLVIYEDGEFFQWLEGPAAGLRRVWNSVRRDPRHTDIEVLSQCSTPFRIFGEWDLRRAERGPLGSLAWPGVHGVGADWVADLYRTPEAATALLNALDAIRASSEVAEHEPVEEALTAPIRDSRSLLCSVLESVLIPQLAGQRIAEPGARDVRIDQLARQLISPNPQAALDRIAEFHARTGSIVSLCSSLFEPTARHLGDLWTEDLCTEFDVTLGLGRLQTAIQRLVSEPHPFDASRRPLVLVAPQPGECHLLGAALDTEVLHEAGWDAQLVFPDCDEALQELLARTWVAAVDLSLSVAFCREHWLPRMAQTIRAVRQASMNPSISVMVGGRVFFEQSEASLLVGADITSDSALQLGALAWHGQRLRA